MNRKAQKAIYMVFCALVNLLIVKFVTDFADDIINIPFIFMHV